MITNQPSLAELLAAYKNNGAADAINAGVTGFTKGMDISAGREKARLEQQNTLTDQDIKRQQVAAEQQRAAAAQQEAQAKFIRVEDAERITGAAPGTFGAPGSVVPTAAVDSYNAIKSKQLEQQNALKQAQMLKDVQLANIASIADQASKDRQAKILEDARNHQITSGTTAQEDALKGAPGFWGTLGNDVYKHLPWTSGDLPSVTEYKRLHNTATNLLGPNIINPPQSVLGKTGATAKPNYTATATHADGSKVGFNSVTNQWEPIQQ